MKIIVQFPHPGSEHSSKTGVIWNSGDHKRKYMEVKGSYLKDDPSSKPIDDTVYFWGEWEAESHVTPISKKQKNYPGNIFTPYYKSFIGKDNTDNKDNTDPFVFGDQFYYCICKQGRYPSLRNLDRGSMILFGSHKDGCFVLDTLFVVKDFIEYEVENIQKIQSNFNSVFYDVSLLPLNTEESNNSAGDKNKSGCAVSINKDDNDDSKPTCNKSKNLKYRIYSAVMYDDREDFDGMFSYAPCLSGSLGQNGFSRPEINQSQYVNINLKQGIKNTSNINIKNVWDDITKQILDQGKYLMIKNTLPQKVTSEI